MKFTSPGDVRDVGYLVNWKVHPPHDLFLYVPALRRVHRLDLNDAVAKTDYTVADILPRYVDAADYTRLPDEDVGETPCYVVDLDPKIEDKPFSRLRIFVEQEHYVPIRVLYFAKNEMLVKQWDARVDTMEELRGVCDRALQHAAEAALPPATGWPDDPATIERLKSLGYLD